MANQTPIRCFRVEDDLWEPAKDKAQQQDTTISAYLRERLEELVQS